MSNRCFGRLLSVLTISIFFIPGAFAQKNYLKGVVVDTTEKKKLHYSIVALVNLADTTLYQSTRSVADGSFAVQKIPAGRYRLMISYPRMADYLKEFTVSDTSKIDLKDIVMVTQATLLEEIVVRSGVPIRMRGDTLEYTADSFAVRPGSNVEELLKRLPGIQVEKNGRITAQGEEVKRVLVDGDEFFSDDPTLATKYLSANAVDKVQVFDQKSEQTQFTGIDDGTRTKTINLKLKSNKKNGYFGKLAAGADGKQYHSYEAMGALFNGTKKMSIFGLSSKTGKEGLSYNELNKYVGEDYEMINDGTGSIIFMSSNDYENENYYGSGIPSIESGGAHYSNKWNQNKQKLFSNYRIKQISAEGWSNNSGTTTLPDGSSFFNTGENSETSYSFMQKASGSFTTTLDSFSTIKFSVNGNMGNGSSTSSGKSFSTNEKGYQVNSSTQRDRNVYENSKMGSNINYQRRFRKEGRTISFVLQQDFNENQNDLFNSFKSSYHDPASRKFKNEDSLNQLQQSRNTFESYGSRLNYTDKLNKELGLAFEYGWKTAVASNDFNTYKSVNDKYEDRIDSLSNDYRFSTSTHITGATLSWNRKKFNITAGGNVFFTGFRQVNHDAKTSSTRNFTNVAPKVSTTWRPKQTTDFSFSYSGETGQPSVEQLQPLRRSSNSLYVRNGNPELKPAFNHRASLTFSKYRPVKGQSLHSNISIDYTENALTSKSYVDAQNRNTMQYINMNSIAGFHGYISYSWRYPKIKVSPTISSSVGRYGSYKVQNDQKIKVESVYSNINARIMWEWEKTMLLSYSANVRYQLGKSDISKTTRNFSHQHNINATFYLFKKAQLGSDCDFNFQPKNSSFNKDFNVILWNAYLQKKFFKKEALEAKVSVNDILNRNTGYGRSVYGNDVYEYNRLVMKRYFMLTVTWNFSKSLGG